MAAPLKHTPADPRHTELAALRAEVDHYREVIRRTADACDAAARGDLEARVRDFEEPGDTGRLMASVNRILDVSDAFVREASASLEHASAGKFYRRVVLRGLPGAYRQSAAVINRASGEMAAQAAEIVSARRKQLAFADSFESQVRGVTETLAASATELHATAQTLTGVASTTADQAATVSASAVQTATSVQTVAAAAEELSSSLGEVDRRVRESVTISSRASADVRQTEVTMTRLSDMSQQIGRVTKLITQIAGQTKLLALNATIEAARAGDAGKGFAVVASEVKSLAQNTATATDEIGSLIVGMQKVASEVAADIASIAQTMTTLEETGMAMAQSVQEQNTATQQISANVHEAATGTDSVSRSIAGVTTAVGETGEAAQQLLDASVGVSRQAEALMAGVTEFLSAIRA